jgi:hypothetical protein
MGGLEAGRYLVVLILTNTLRRREAGQYSLLHLCSLLRFESFLAVNIREGKLGVSIIGVEHSVTVSYRCWIHLVMHMSLLL